jgi:spermidine synthase
VKPWETVEKALAPDGTEMVLAHRDGEWVVRYGGKVLMSSRQHGSEDALAELALKKAGHRRAVLVGGLGLGFTARAALERIPTDARVVVAELTPALVDWNRRLVGKLAGRPLDDRRCTLQVGDVMDRIAEARGAYDAILLDVDNGPGSMVHEDNHRIYGHHGIAACRVALAEGGVLAVWSAHHDESYLRRLEQGGFEATARVMPARGPAGGLKHVLFFAVKAPPARRGGAGGAGRTRGVRSARVDRGR